MMLDIELKGTVILSGRVTDVDGKPVAEVDINAWGIYDSSVQTSKDGTYSIELAHGYYTLFIEPPEDSWLGYQYLDIEIEEDMTLDITLELGVIGVNPKAKRTISWGKIKQNALLQNYPNPFNPETWIPYLLAEPAEVMIQIYSITGQLVRTLYIEQQDSGEYVSKSSAAHWDGRNDVGERVSSGVYFYRIQAGVFTAMRKLTVSK